MKNNLQVSVVEDNQNRNITVLRIASAARNSITQLYPKRVQVSIRSIEDLARKLMAKLSLHHICDVTLGTNIQFENDRTVIFDSLKCLKEYDFQTDALTHSITLKWSFIFSSADDLGEHVHSVLVRISEQPNPGIILQKFLSGHNEDIESLNGEFFSPIACKIDFLDSRFSTELLAVITEWVNSLPRAATTFGIFTKLRDNEEKIKAFIYGTLPPMTILAYIGAWLIYIPTNETNSIRIASAWILGGGIVFLLSRYLTSKINSIIFQNTRRICTVPVFQITAGDNNRITEYLAKSPKSMIAAGAAVLTYGALKAFGFFMGGKLIALLFS
jgi:hypothetical protein